MMFSDILHKRKGVAMSAIKEMLLKNEFLPVEQKPVVKFLRRFFPPDPVRAFFHVTGKDDESDITIVMDEEGMIWIVEDHPECLEFLGEHGFGQINSPVLPQR